MNPDRSNNCGLPPKFSMSIPVTLRMPNALSSYSVTTVSSNSSISSTYRDGTDTKPRHLLPEGVSFADALPTEIKPICKVEKPDLSLLLMLSFPMKLHLLLEKCGWEQPKRKKRKRSSSKGCAKLKRFECSSSLADTSSYSSGFGKRHKTGEEQLRDTDSYSTLGTENSNDTDNNKEAEGKNDTTPSTKADGDTSDAKKNKIIGWVANGTAFKIYDEERFAREIMPYYHLGHISGKKKQEKTFQDFQRNLDLWGFTDIQCVEGPPIRRIHICSHPSFIRGQTNKCREMRYRPRRI